MKHTASLLFEKKVEHESDLKNLAKDMAAFFDEDSILLLSGELGAGKTTTIRYLCDLFQMQGVQSPTYAIHQRYQTVKKSIDHFDLYRLQSEDELVATGFWDLLQERRSLVFIEWHENIKDQSWLDFEKDKRKIFGLKIQVQAKERIFSFFRLS